MPDQPPVPSLSELTFETDRPWILRDPVGDRALVFLVPPSVVARLDAAGACTTLRLERGLTVSFDHDGLLVMLEIEAASRNADLLERIAPVVERARRVQATAEAKARRAILHVIPRGQGTE